jgi:hypothetical protein
MLEVIHPLFQEQILFGIMEQIFQYISHLYKIIKIIKKLLIKQINFFDNFIYINYEFTYRI